jgi:hypothetical protein
VKRPQSCQKLGRNSRHAGKLLAPASTRPFPFAPARITARWGTPKDPIGTPNRAGTRYSAICYQVDVPNLVCFSAQTHVPYLRPSLQARWGSIVICGVCSLQRPEHLPDDRSNNERRVGGGSLRYSRGDRTNWSRNVSRSHKYNRVERKRAQRVDHDQWRPHQSISRPGYDTYPRERLQ